MFEMRVKCPRCGRIWTVPQGTPDIVCNCHLYCSQGDKPSDCNVTPVTSGVQLGWPTGLHVGEDDDRDDIMHVTYYCSVHKEYYDKVPITINCDWEKWYSRRAPKKLRVSHGEY